MATKTWFKKGEDGFAYITCETWSDLKRQLQTFLNRLNKGKEWVFRGQTSDWPLKTTLERACDYANILGEDVSRVECQMIRSFRRNYSGNDRELALNDDLYCMALMQHHGAPTRLLDFTYSPYIAAHNAMEELPKKPLGQDKSHKTDKQDANVIWCLNGDWCGRAARQKVPDHLLKARNTDRLRDNTSFRRLYNNTRTFVFLENPFLLNTRLIAQQGVFLCPGSTSVPFVKNLQELPDFQSEESIRKIRCQLSNDERCKAMSEIQRMNVSRASLYPGLDGFASSYKTRARFFLAQSKRGVGSNQ